MRADLKEKLLSWKQRYFQTNYFFIISEIGRNYGCKDL
jgi:hypothetical protein